jgi:hypothetical protein
MQKTLFDSKEPEFNEHSYFGRFEEFRSVADPRKAFFSNSRIRGMQAMLSKVNEEEDQCFKANGDRRVLRTAEEIKQIRTA